MDQIEFVKANRDDRKYRFIKLQNHLKCLLIEDKEADKSAASLNIKVGSCLDPKTH